MRIIGFSKKWDKLYQPEFSTFRFPRKDKDWQIGEQVKIVFHPRHKDHEFICNAEIKAKTPKTVFEITDAEAKLDGFNSTREIQLWMINTYHRADVLLQTMNKIILRRLSVESAKSESQKEDGR